MASRNVASLLFTAALAACGGAVAGDHGAPSPPADAGADTGFVGGDDVAPDAEIVALTAYLQRLGVHAEPKLTPPANVSMTT